MEMVMMEEVENYGDRSDRDGEEEDDDSGDGGGSNSSRCDNNGYIGGGQAEPSKNFYGYYYSRGIPALAISSKEYIERSKRARSIVASTPILNADNQRKRPTEEASPILLEPKGH
ncbi:hypothetical protein RCL_jg12109.t1 [Rhizophagus clarus]|uniref:Uncharacterized protein n=1 Tax=Rhizophagus clarus TaxID=94130 RepID=A0A8H3QFM2_9GLOM|nr:hypothetical protein RCL_jg12109.t1 [Rhizophagus clarus]